MGGKNRMMSQGNISYQKNINYQWSQDIEQWCDQLRNAYDRKKNT